MRARSVKPGLFKNEELAEIEPLGRLLFVGLWCMADREGRLEDRHRRIKAEVLPYDDVDVDALLQSLHDKNFIARYQAENQPYIQVINFTKHQRPHNNESPSTIPERTFVQGRKPFQLRKKALRPCILDTSSLNPSSLNPSTHQPHSSAKNAEDDFSLFWNSYPKKVGKLDAQKAWKKNGRPDIETILKAVELQKLSSQWIKDGGKFIPNPATWLNGGRWDDVPQKDQDEVEAWLLRQNSQQ